ncbi:hypothetical protein EUX98_g8164 [Antrodiella citrinella]|uniref:Uncharacterized protein n=1 Tax=Antrodiella citrinella TaxID=2447956 RepID=A0A4S4MCK4_9APHY|nr:hypothetical protein EUX98_g8164 [Antrodiella citrinella]
MSCALYRSDAIRRRAGRGKKVRFSSWDTVALYSYISPYQSCENIAATPFQPSKERTGFSMNELVDQIFKVYDVNTPRSTENRNPILSVGEECSRSTPACSTPPRPTGNRTPSSSVVEAADKRDKATSACVTPPSTKLTPLPNVDDLMRRYFKTTPLRVSTRYLKLQSAVVRGWEEQLVRGQKAVVHDWLEDVSYNPWC